MGIGLQHCIVDTESELILTINVSVVYMGPDVVIWMWATSITKGVLRGGH